MTFQQEFASWFSPKCSSVGEIPKVGQQAPDTPKLGLQNGRPAVISFLRHCGCPWAEKTFLNLREAARNHKDIDFFAVSHSDQESTDNWLKALPQAGSETSNLKVVVDDKVEIYQAWGLGAASFFHVLSPFQLWNVYKAGRDEGLWNRPTESGSRWQMSGFFAVDGNGFVTWGGPAQRADDAPTFESAIDSIGKTQSKL